MDGAEGRKRLHTCPTELSYPECRAVASCFIDNVKCVAHYANTKTQRVRKWIGLLRLSLAFPTPNFTANKLLKRSGPPPHLNSMPPLMVQITPSHKEARARRAISRGAGRPHMGKVQTRVRLWDTAPTLVIIVAIVDVTQHN